VTDQELAAQLGVSVEQLRQLCRQRGTTRDALEHANLDALRKGLRKLIHPGNATGRVDHKLRHRHGSDAVDHGALGRAVRQMERMHERVQEQAERAAHRHGRRRHLALVCAADTPEAPHRWEWLGPGNVGGRTRALVIHPQEPERMLAGSAGGGVWFTENGGRRWDPVDDFMANLAVCSLALDPTDPELVYAGTGEKFGNLDALGGGGIFRILSGSHWSLLPGTQEFGAVNRLGVSCDGRVLLAATPAGLMRCADLAGGHWQRVLRAEMVDVKCHPTQPGRAVAASAHGRVWHTRDAGASWTLAEHDGRWTARVELTYARARPQVVYASTDTAQGGGLWRSTDGGKSFKRRPTLDAHGRPAPFLGDQGWYNNALWADDPTDPGLLLIGGINLWRSTDGGATLREISTWTDRRAIHPDHHAIVSHPHYDGRECFTVYFGNDGGVFVAADVRVVGSEAKPPYIKGHRELNNNLGVTQFYSGAVHAASGRLIGGAQDNGSLTLDPGERSEQWRKWAGGDGGFCAIDPEDPDTFYGEYARLALYRTTDAGRTKADGDNGYICGQFWNYALGKKGNWDWKPEPFQIPDARNGEALFIAPFVLDPNHRERLLAGGASLWETRDARAPNTNTSGPRWRAIKPPVGSYISAIAICPGHPEVVWVGHEDGRVFRSGNAMAAKPRWTHRAGTGKGRLHPRRICTRLLALPGDPLSAYACFGGFAPDNLWLTRDGGAHWTQIGQALPDAPVNSIVVHPHHPERLYVGTEVGLFSSPDGGATWTPADEGPAHVAVNELFWGGTMLYAATHGRGMFRIDLS
jgi:photosystem II stability/assembly factor-like uncharacterized protein